jgi:hypothetical protein
MNWLKRLFNPVPNRTIAKISSAPNGASLERWQKDDGLVNWARSSPEFAYLMAVVQSQRTTGYPARGQQITDVQCAVELGRKEGYDDCHSVLLALRQFAPVPKDEIPADYDNSE